MMVLEVKQMATKMDHLLICDSFYILIPKLLMDWFTVTGVLQTLFNYRVLFKKFHSKAVKLLKSVLISHDVSFFISKRIKNHTIIEYITAFYLRIANLFYNAAGLLGTFNRNIIVITVTFLHILF